MGGFFFVGDEGFLIDDGREGRCVGELPLFTGWITIMTEVGYP